MISSQKQNNKNILYLNFNRSILKRIYEQIFYLGKKKYLNKKEKEFLEIKYYKFLIKFLPYLKNMLSMHLLGLILIILQKFNYIKHVISSEFLSYYFSKKVITDIEKRYQIFCS